MLNERERKELNESGCKYYIEFVCDPNSNDTRLSNGYYIVARTKDDAILFSCKTRDMAIGFCYGRGIEKDIAEL
jgi:hypothetical protein